MFKLFPFPIRDRTTAFILCLKFIFSRLIFSYMIPDKKYDVEPDFIYGGFIFMFIWPRNIL